MARPKKCKIIDICLKHTKFTPNLVSTKNIILNAEELQAIKIKDIDNYGCIDWGEKMWVSKSTFMNIYNQAHKKIAKALINWYSIEFECWIK